MTPDIQKEVSTLIREGRQPEALALLQDAAATHRTDVALQLLLAHCLLMSKDSAAALAAAKEAVHRSPLEPAAHFLCARLHFAQHDFAAARENCEAVIDQTTDVAAYYAESCRLLHAASSLELGDLARAQAQLNQVRQNCVVCAERVMTRNSVADALQAALGAQQSSVAR